MSAPITPARKFEIRERRLLQDEASSPGVDRLDEERLDDAGSLDHAASSEGVEGADHVAEVLETLESEARVAFSQHLVRVARLVGARVPAPIVAKLSEVVVRSCHDREFSASET